MMMRVKTQRGYVMPGLGTIINTAAIVAGGLLGLLFKNLLTKSMEDTLLKASSVCVLFIGIGGAMLGLSVENGYVGEISFAPNGLPTSHKKDHGVGLASVAATVKRHNGTLSIAAKDGVFSAHILLSL